jgi:hypothetical protein
MQLAWGVYVCSSPAGLCAYVCVVSLSLCRLAASPGFACTTYTCKWLQALIQQGADSADRSAGLLYCSERTVRSTGRLFYSERA